jgi:hypothetical protein
MYIPLVCDLSHYNIVATPITVEKLHIPGRRDSHDGAERHPNLNRVGH